MGRSWKTKRIEPRQKETRRTNESIVTRNTDQCIQDLKRNARGWHVVFSQGKKSWLDRKARICGWTNTFVTIVKPETAHELSVTSRFFYLDYSWCVALLLTIENKIGETNLSNQISSIWMHQLQKQYYLFIIRYCQYYYK